MTEETEARAMRGVKKSRLVEARELCIRIKDRVMVGEREWPRTNER